MADTTDRQALLSTLTTEHFTLQGARASVVGETGARSSLYLSAVSSALIALVFVAQVSTIGQTFRLRRGAASPRRRRVAPAAARARRRAPSRRASPTPSPPARVPRAEPIAARSCALLIGAAASTDPAPAVGSGAVASEWHAMSDRTARPALHRGHPRQPRTRARVTSNRKGETLWNPPTSCPSSPCSRS
jgi:hypothetical protein